MAKSDNCCHSTEARHWIRYLLHSLSDWDVIKALASLRQLSGTLSLFVVDVAGDISRMSKTRIRKKRKGKYFWFCEDILPVDSPLQR